MVAAVQPKPVPIVYLTEWRCPSCRTLLCKVALPPGSVIELKCPRCNAFVVKHVDR